jgi:hypothetical protein
MKTTTVLTELTNKDTAYICSHWNDLYNGIARIGIFISNQQELESLKDLGFDFEIMICKKRDGSEFFEPVNIGLYNFEDAQNRLKMHFTASNDYFYQNNETIAQAAQNRLKDLLNDDFTSIADLEEQVLEVLEPFKGKQEGYYDCNDNLIISDEDINSPDFCGYYEDVWSYAIFAVIEPKNEEEEES